MREVSDAGPQGDIYWIAHGTSLLRAAPEHVKPAVYKDTGATDTMDPLDRAKVLFGGAQPWSHTLHGPDRGRGKRLTPTRRPRSSTGSTLMTPTWAPLEPIGGMNLSEIPSSRTRTTGLPLIKAVCGLDITSIRGLTSLHPIQSLMECPCISFDLIGTRPFAVKA